MNLDKAISAATPFLKNAEGFREKAYRHKQHDKDGVWRGKWEPWTVGYGFTYDEQGKPITETSTMDRARADVFFAKQVQQRAEAILRTLPGVPLTSNQLAALISLHHNIGPGNWSTSTVRRRLKAGDYKGAAEAFKLWHRGNKPYDLMSRRLKEIALFNKP